MELDFKDTFKEYALEICINKISNAITKCEFCTLENKKEVNKETYYKLNVSPNKNDNASVFWDKVVYQMLTSDDGALVIQTNDDNFLVAEDFTLRESAVNQNIYSNVLVSNYVFKKSFTEESVWRFKFNRAPIINLIDLVYEEFGKLIYSAIKNYNRKNSRKIIVRVGAMFEQFKKRISEDGSTEYDMILDDLFENRLKGFMSERDSATPLQEGLDLEEMSPGSSGRVGENSTRDIKSLFEDLLDIFADAYNIPRGLLKGDVADVEAMTDNFIAFCIKPIAELIENEINRKYYTQSEYLKGTKLKIRTDSIRNNNIDRFANNAEALYRIRAVNPNWIRRRIGEEEIEEDWAEEYAQTKNYENINQHVRNDDS